MAGSSFDCFPISQQTLDGLKKANFKTPTEIQRLTLGHSIIGWDIVGAAKTGSGKTLALLIPVLECLWRNKWTSLDGLGAIIITPTRELAFQIYKVLNDIGFFHKFSAALLIGGTDISYEKIRMPSVNIAISTPGRLLQHMDENEYFSCNNLQILVIDEADRILDMGFSQQVDAIIQNIPNQRQTLLFSATQTKKVEDLARLSLKDPVFISAHENCIQATPDQLVQSYFVCEEEEKINILWSYLTQAKNLQKKVLIFVTCCKQARFLTEAFLRMSPAMTVLGLWGHMKQTKRLEHFRLFDQKNARVAMIATDLASRGLDFTGLDIVFQLDCPSSSDDYIHRVGRTARMNEKGEAVLLLTPRQESPFVDILRKNNIPIAKSRSMTKRLKDIRLRLSNIMVPFPYLKEFAKRSLVDYAKAIYFMKLKTVFDVLSIDFNLLALSYGLQIAPRIRFLQKRGLKVERKLPWPDLDGPRPSSSTVDDKTITEQVQINEEPSISSDKDGKRLLFESQNEPMDEESDQEPFMKIARTDVFNVVPGVDQEEEILSRISKDKPITKVQFAKQLKRRLGPVSTKIRFNQGSDDE